MRLNHLLIQNFRALENINLTFRGFADVIVGPNAVGKTTILEAIRITTAILAPRIPNEAQQCLIGLGAISPHLPQQLNFGALARDTRVPVTIACRYELSDREISQLDSLVPALSNSVVQAGLGAAGLDRLNMVPFLSSPQGKKAVTEAADFVTTNLAPIKTSRTCNLQVTCDPKQQNFSGLDQLSQLVIAALEGILPPHLTLFSYFPADRAMPTGDVAIQVGAPDVNAQLLSHNTQPQTKFHRLKTTIVNSYLLNGADPKGILDDFRKISSHLLKDREVLGLEIDNFGLVSVRVKDLITNQIFDLDNMSSGEKGLLLMFLLITRSMEQGGILLIDEPELHLNPAVCKMLLPFLVDEYLKPRNLQAIICSHSPEILGVAFDREDCGLHHLQSQILISPILPQDKREVFDALRRLGTSESDVLFSSGSIFVEGDDDIDILEAGFPNILNRYKITHLQGRGNVEKEIRTLQEAEARGEVETLKCFIFDLDNAPTTLKSSAFVRVNQWERRCIENYLINDNAIYECLRDDGLAIGKIENRGEVPTILKQIALSQLNDTIADAIYKKQSLADLGTPRLRELAGKSFPESAEFLFRRIESAQAQIRHLTRADWCKQFEHLCEEEWKVVAPRWETDWITLCDGKRLFRDLHQKYGVKVSPIKFKVRIMERLTRDHVAEWVLVESILRDSLKP